MKKWCRKRVVVLLWSFLIVGSPFFVSAETVRDKATKHFDSIQWTTNPSHLQAVPVPGRSVVGGNESFVALTLNSSAKVSGVYPQIDGVGQLFYGDCDQKLIQVLEKLQVALLKKKVPQEQVSPSRSYLSPITEYRLKKITNPKYCFFSRPSGTVPEIQTSTIALLCTEERIQKVLFLYGTFTFEKGLWKITDIVFDSKSYASFIN